MKEYKFLTKLFGVICLVWTVLCRHTHIYIHIYIFNIYIFLLIIIKVFWKYLSLRGMQ